MARDIVVYSNGDADVTKKMVAAAEGKRVTVESRKIVALERKHPDHPDVIVHFADGSMKEEAFMVRVTKSIITLFLTRIGADILWIRPRHLQPELTDPSLNNSA